MALFTPKLHFGPGFPAVDVEQFAVLSELTRLHTLTVHNLDVDISKRLPLWIQKNPSFSSANYEDLAQSWVLFTASKVHTFSVHTLFCESHRLCVDAVSKISVIHFQFEWENWPSILIENDPAHEFDSQLCV